MFVGGQDGDFRRGVDHDRGGVAELFRGLDSGGDPVDAAANVPPNVAHTWALSSSMSGGEKVEGAILSTPPWLPLERTSYDPTTQAHLRAIVCNGEWAWLRYPNGCEWALGVIECESGGNRDAYNPAGPYISIWQVLNGPHDIYLNTVEANIQFVEWERGIRKTSPWPGCSPSMPR